MQPIVTLCETQDWSNSTFFCQYEIIEEARKKVLRFGPCSTTLGELFDDGWYIQSGYFNKKSKCYVRSVKYYLQRSRERYLLGKFKEYTWTTIKDLSALVKDGKQMVNMCSSVPSETDSWASLIKKYPRQPKEIMIGNMSLNEYVRMSLN